MWERYNKNFGKAGSIAKKTDELLISTRKFSEENKKGKLILLNKDVWILQRNRMFCANPWEGATDRKFQPKIFVVSLRISCEAINSSQNILQPH